MSHTPRLTTKDGKPLHWPADAFPLTVGFWPGCPLRVVVGAVRAMDAWNKAAKRAGDGPLFRMLYVTDDLVDVMVGELVTALDPDDCGDFETPNVGALIPHSTWFPDDFDDPDEHGACDLTWDADGIILTAAIAIIDHARGYNTTVAVHELGHALGFGHSRQPGAVMHPTHGGSRPGKRLAAMATPGP